MHNEIMETNTETNNRQKTQVAFFLFFFILQLLILRKSRNLLWNKSQTTHDIIKFDLESQDHQLINGGTERLSSGEAGIEDV